MKILRKYLFHVQESVFEGELTPKQFKRLKSELDNLTCEEDQVLIYYTCNVKDIRNESLGYPTDDPTILIE